MLIAISIFVFVALGCGLISFPDRTEDFIPGTYIRFSSHEYGKEYDTLVITLQNESAHEFKVTRKWRYERELDGIAIEPKYQRQSSTGIYHSSDKVMQDTESGTLYTFNIKEKLLFNGDIKYKKI